MKKKRANWPSLASLWNSFLSYFARISCSLRILRGQRETFREEEWGQGAQRGQKRQVLLIVLVDSRIPHRHLVCPQIIPFQISIVPHELHTRQWEEREERRERVKRSEWQTWMSSSVQTSSLSERTFEICVPRFLWTPLHSMHTKIPKLIDAHSGSAEKSFFFFWESNQLINTKINNNKMSIINGHI